MVINTFTVIRNDVDVQAQKKQLANMPGYVGDTISPVVR